MNSTLHRSARWISLLFVIILLAALSALPNRPAAAQSQPEKQNGFNYVSYDSSHYGTPQAAQAMARLKDTGANWVSIVVTQFQDTYTSTTIRPADVMQTDAQVRQMIRDAKALGLKVMLKPHLNLQESDHWHGEIGLGFNTEAQWNAWFSSYRTFINKYAQIAKEEGVDQFAIGTELSGTQFREAQWRTTIAGVRAIYSGPLTYAANFDAALTVPWWDAMDFIGIDAYYPMTNKMNPTRTELANAWKPIITQIEGLQKQFNRPVIFTEIGWVSIDGANREYRNNVYEPGPIDLQEQADLYHSVLTGIYTKPWFAGVFFWTWSLDPFEGGTCDRYWAVYDKPAEAVVRTAFGAPPRQPNVFPEVNESVTRTIYDDALASGWGDGSWNMNRSYSATNQVHSGLRSISASPTSIWAGLGMFHSGVDTSPYHFLEFYLRLESAATEIYVFATDRNGDQLYLRSLEDCRYTSDTLIQGKVWTRVRIPLEHLHADKQTITGVAVMVGEVKGNFHVDDVRLVGAKSGGGGNQAVTFTAAEDSYTSEAQQTKSFGTAKVLKVQNSRRDFNTYLKFNVSGLTAPVKKATLRLFVTDTSDNSGAVFAVSSSWSESSLRWQNAPVISGAPVAPAKSATTKQYIEWDVTSAISGNGAVSLAVSGGSTNTAGYVSREGKQKPQLVIEFGP